MTAPTIELAPTIALAAAGKIVAETRDDSKLGRGVHSYSRTIGLPADGGTCPGASAECITWCYGGGGNYRFPSVKGRLEKNRDAGADVPAITIPDGAPLRIHVTGDFDTPEYVDAWIANIRSRPDVGAWFYTRSWAVDDRDLVAAIRRLAALPNVQGWASVDASMPRPPRWLRPAWSPGDDRYDPATTIDCPALVVKQSGRGRISCQTCRYCFRPATNRRTGVRWPYIH